MNKPSKKPKNQLPKWTKQQNNETPTIIFQQRFNL